MKRIGASGRIPWNAAVIRREREFGWFRQNERELIEQARKRRLEVEEARRQADARTSRELHWRRCPHCGGQMAPEVIEGTVVEKCAGCGGIFLERRDLDKVLLRRNEGQRGFRGH
jgi:hypothetical protein